MSFGKKKIKIVMQGFKVINFIPGFLFEIVINSAKGQMTTTCYF